MPANHYEVYAIRYAEFTKRTRRDSFIFDPSHDVPPTLPHDIDYFIMEDMLKGYDVLTKLAGERQLVIPGHDPLVRQRFPVAFADARPGVWRLDLGVI